MVSFADFRSRRRFDSLDALRCLSILAVLWHHSPHVSFTPLTRGFLGVDLFFVLSGFLITTLLLREREDAGSVSLKGFYWRRMLRIFPLYYAVLFLYAGLMAFAKTGSDTAQAFFEAFPWYLTYTANWGPKEDTFAHAWSLAVEEQFYLLWPPLLVLLEPRRARQVLMVFLAAVVALDFGVFGPGTLNLARQLTPFAAVAWGALLALLLAERASFDRIAAVAGAHGFIAVPLVALACLIWIPGDIGGLPRLCIHLSMVALVAAVVVPPTHAMASVCRSRVVVHIGAISYGIYLLHQLCNVAVYKLLAGVSGPWLTPSFFLLSTALSVVVATLSFRTFEAFFMRFKNRVGSAVSADVVLVPLQPLPPLGPRLIDVRTPNDAPSRSAGRTREPASNETVF
jgi:peptidoglycan/LPS O-acetylase OafA/YrhL